MSVARIRFGLVLLGGALAVACATPPKPHELESFERLRALPETKAAADAAPDRLRQADHLLERSREQWQDNELDLSRHLALLGQAQVKHALALYQQEDARRRTKKARDEQQVLDEDIQRLEGELGALNEQIALLERLQQQQEEQQRIQAQASAEQQRLVGELEQQKARGEAVEKIKAAELAIKEAETVNAARYAQASFQSGQDLLDRARRELDAGQLDAARLSADLARQKAASATDEARPQHQQDAQQAERTAKAEALARDAASIPLIEVRRDARGSLQRLILHVVATRLFTGARATSLSPAGEPLLEEVARLLQKYPDYPVQVIGHTDTRGRQDALLARSLARAQAVFNGLVGRGVEARRMIVTGKGGEDPVADNRSGAGRARNNRIEIVFMYQ